LQGSSQKDAFAEKPSLLSVNKRVRKVDERSAAYTEIHERGACCSRYFSHALIDFSSTSAMLCVRAATAAGDSTERLAGAQEMVDQYYDLATDFYEFGWGDSFHFAHRYKGETLRESIVRHEHFLSSKLGLEVRAPFERTLIPRCSALPSVVTACLPCRPCRRA
jgi:hypothetical protein